MTIPDPRDLITIWREQAAERRLYGAEPSAATLEACAADLERILRERDQFEVSEPEAARISGYERSALYKMRARGDLVNVGTSGSPKYRFGDLPRKPGTARLGQHRLVGPGDIGDQAVRSRARARNP